MDTSLNYGSGGHGDGYSIGHNAFWAIVMAEWEEKAEDSPCAVAFRTVTTEELKPVFYEGHRILLTADEFDYSHWVITADDDQRVYELHFYPRNHTLHLAIFSPFGQEDAHDKLAKIVAMAPAIQDRGEEWVDVAFWTLAPNGAATYQDRFIEASEWKDVRINYPITVQESLDKIHAWKQPPDKRGRLMLLHGPAGTGKTNTISSLARSWKSWCSVHYVVDPDQFFGSAHYMMSVLLDSSFTTEDAILTTSDTEEGSHKWRLIVVEDADELLSYDAKQQKGQDVSRLLSLCDGLVGQGMRILVLITTNEEVGKMHPAIIRPGRCLTNLAIGKLPQEEANHWRTAHGLKALTPGTARDRGASTLAELYEELDKSQIVAGDYGPRRVGF